MEIIRLDENNKTCKIFRGENCIFKNNGCLRWAFYENNT